MNFLFETKDYGVYLLPEDDRIFEPDCDIYVNYVIVNKCTQAWECALPTMPGAISTCRVAQELLDKAEITKAEVKSIN